MSLYNNLLFINKIIVTLIFIESQPILVSLFVSVCSMCSIFPVDYSTDFHFKVCVYNNKLKALIGPLSLFLFGFNRAQF